MAEEISTPGEGQIKGLLTFAANPALSSPDSEKLAQALPLLECMVSLDNYLNETTRHAHVIFPSPSFLESAHFDMWSRSEEHTSELQSLMRISYAVFCLKKKKHNTVIKRL